MIVTNDQGNTYGLGNPVKDAFVRQFMRGLKKRKSTEITQRQATPISLDMLRVLHSHLAIAPGFTEASRLWFFAVSAFAFYGMCRINEVLSLKWKNLTLGLARPNKLEGRKTEVAEGRCNYMHQRESNGLLIDDMADTDHNWNDNDYVFPALSKISKSVIKTDDSSTAVRMHEWTRFMFAPPERRWSLRMVKWWAEWTQNESAETLVRYLLDQAATDEDTQLADCLAPDRDLHVGCPTTFSRRKRNTTEPARQLSSSIEKWLKTVENSVKALEGKIDMLVSIIQPTDQRSQAQHTRTRPERRVQKDINSPTSKGLEGYVPMYWNADAARHLFKHVSEWTSLERKKSGVLPSRLSVAKLLLKMSETSLFKKEF
ncbi:Integrase-like, catalytic domain [Phytophthora cactorum]|nr:Integrase-like, catalytic domain [Phytophthora cactorum]